jgi:hypothetical protein
MKGSVTVASLPKDHATANEMVMQFNRGGKSETKRMTKSEKYPLAQGTAGEVGFCKEHSMDIRQLWH